MSTHLAGYQPFPFPKDLFAKFIKENDGYFPIRLQALPEGTVANAHTPVYQITAEGEYSRLVTFFETLLTQVWYPTTVATLSRRARERIEGGFERSSAAGRADPGVDFGLHDFGFRGCCTVEQAMLGGSAHLLNFRGTDTMAAAYYVQMELNGGKPVGTSVPASEHSVMTAWPTELEAIERMVDEFGAGTYSVVMDSYDYSRALHELLPVVKEKKLGKGGVLVIRPDSGDPVWCVVEGLKALEKTFGAEENARGYKVVNKARVIQGDGINITTLGEILDAVLAAGFSAENVVFGMGAGLLQKVNRDTMSFATKLCYIVNADGREMNVMKRPTTDSGKTSLPGVLEVKRVGGVPTVFPEGAGPAGEEDLLRTVYDKGPVPGAWEGTFDALRDKVQREWEACPPKYDPLSDELKLKVAQVLGK